MRRLAVCADDFGLAPEVDAGILRLAAAGRVTAVSCLAGTAAFARDAPALLDTPAEAGLHLDLTDGTDGEPPVGLVSLLARSYLCRLDGAAVRRQVARQLDAFERVSGRPPAFVDGHRHVHQLPGVAGPLLEALGAGPAARALADQGVPCNADFCGVYGLQPRAPYRTLVQGWLEGVGDGGVLMCHPAEPGPVVHAEARVAELAYLESAAFEADCRAAGVALVGPSGLRPEAPPVPESAHRCG